MQVPCLKWPCVGRDLLWLHCGETKRSGFVKRGGWLRRCAGCWRRCGSEKEQRRAGTVSTSTLAPTWTELPASGLRDSDRNDSQSLTETKKHTSFHVPETMSVFPWNGLLSSDSQTCNKCPQCNNMLITLDRGWDLERVHAALRLHTKYISTIINAF